MMKYSRISLLIQVRIRLISEKKAVLLLADNGKAFDPTQADTVPKDFEEMDTGGMGIAMVRQMTDTMLYQRRSGKNYLLLTVPLTHE